MLRYDIIDQKNKMDVDKQKITLERSFADAKKINENEVNKIVKDTDGIVKFTKEEKVMWESQKIELTHKIKQLQRKLTDENERIKELEKNLKDL